MCCFFFNDTATTEIYTLSLHDALPISAVSSRCSRGSASRSAACCTSSSESSRSGSPAPWRTRAGRLRAAQVRRRRPAPDRSEEHTSELQSRQYLVCRLLLEKKKKNHSS